MGNSLQDQLLKAGIANKQQAQNADSERRRKKRKNKRGEPSTDEGKQALQRAQAEKAAHDRELNRQQREKAERKAIAAQIRQLVDMNKLSRENAESDYNFVDGTKVRKLLVTGELHAQLANGRLSIARIDDRYEVIPTVVAEKISLRDSSVIIPIERSSPVEDADDPYADYKVPDDMMW